MNKNSQPKKSKKFRRRAFGLIALLAVVVPLLASREASAETEYDDGAEACMAYGIFTYLIDGTHSSPYLTVPNLLPDWDVTAVVIATGNGDDEHTVYTPVEEGQTINFGQSIHHVHICKTQIVPEYPEPEVTTSTSTSTTTVPGPTSSVPVTTSAPSSTAIVPSTTSAVAPPPIPPTTQCTITSTTVLVPHPCLPVFPEGTSTTTASTTTQAPSSSITTTTVAFAATTTQGPTNQLPATGLDDPADLFWIAVVFACAGGFLMLLTRRVWG